MAEHENDEGSFNFAREIPAERAGSIWPSSRLGRTPVPLSFRPSGSPAPRQDLTPPRRAARARRTCSVNGPFTMDARRGGGGGPVVVGYTRRAGYSRDEFPPSIFRIREHVARSRTKIEKFDRLSLEFFFLFFFPHAEIQNYDRLLSWRASERNLETSGATIVDQRARPRDWGPRGLKVPRVLTFVEHVHALLVSAGSSKPSHVFRRR